MTQQTTTATRSNRFAVADLITTGVFTAIYFVIVAVAALFCNVVLTVAGNLFLPAIAALLAGPVYMLLAARVRTFGPITVMGVVLGLFLVCSGHFALSLVTSAVFPCLADLIAKAGAYRNTAAMLASYVVFSFGCLGPILPLWMMKDAYVASLERKGKDAAYIDLVFSHVNGAMFGVTIAAVVVCALIGGAFGLRMMTRHFEKAGVLG